MEKKNAFTITRARPEDAAALLDYLKIVGGETDNLSFGAEGVPLAPEEEQAYLRTQVDSPDHVQYLARVDGELIGTASLNRKPGRMRHRGVFGISLKRAWWGCGTASALTEAVLAFRGKTALPSSISRCAATMSAPSGCMKNSASGSCAPSRPFSASAGRTLILM